MNSSSDSLYAFRDSVSTVFRLMMSAFRRDFEKAPEQFDAYLNSTVQMLEAKDNAKASVVAMSNQVGDTLTHAFLAKSDSSPDIFEPQPTSPRRSSPKLVIYPEEAPPQTVIVQKMPSEAKIVHVDEPVNTIISGLTIHEADERDAVSDVVSDVVSEAPSFILSDHGDADNEADDADDADEAEETEEADEDEEKTTKISIGRGKKRRDYLLGTVSNHVYDIEADGTAGALLGLYENKKLVPF